MKQIWDNSNIIESYPDVCSPLTFSFAKYVYREIYIQSAFIFGGDYKFTREMYRKYETMLGYIDGKFYYNLDTWLTMISYAPGFNKNQKYLQEMMGVKKEDFLEVPEVSLGLLIKARALIKFLCNHFVLNKKTKHWILEFDREFQTISKDLEGAKDCFGGMEDFFKIEQQFLYNWQIPILNDYAVMIYTGILKKACHLFHKEEINSKELGIGIYGNAAMVVTLREIAKSLKLKNVVKRTIADNALTTEIIWEELNKDLGLKNDLDKFIHKYGLRNGNNLKLETPNLSEQPIEIAGLIKQYVELEEELKSTEEDRDFKRNLVIRYLLKRATDSIRNREEMRIKRSQLVGIVRKCMLVIAKDFKKQGLIEEESDIFFLDLDEILGTMRAISVTNNLKGIIAIRKKEQIHFIESHTKNHFTTNIIPQLDSEKAEKKDSDYDKKTFIGKGNYPGNVEGEVVVMKNLNFDADVKGKILVCRYTDPNWVPLMGVVKALIVERGGLLSHAAIVSRELKVPSIIGIEDATDRLKNGQRVVVDSAEGTLELI